MSGDDPLGDREAETRPARAVAPDPGQAGERLEDTVALSGRDPRSLIADGEFDPTIRRSDRDADRRPRRRMVQRIVDEDEHELGQPIAITGHRCRRPGFVAGLGSQLDLSHRGQGSRLPDGVQRDRPEVGRASNDDEARRLR